MLGFDVKIATKNKKVSSAVTVVGQRRRQRKRCPVETTTGVGCFKRLFAGGETPV